MSASRKAKGKRVAARRAGAAEPTSAAPFEGGEAPADADGRRPSQRPIATRPSARRAGARASSGSSAASKLGKKKRASAAASARAPGVTTVGGDAPVAVAPPQPASPAVSPEEAQAHLRQIQHSLGALLKDVDGGAGDADARRRAARAMEHIAARLDPEAPMATVAPGGSVAARQLLSPDHYLRKWARFAMRHRSEEVDDFGFDAAYEAEMQSLLDHIFHDYFRVQVRGVEHVPDRGRALLVGNHSGALPWDGLMLKTALHAHHAERRPLRWLAEDFAFHAPFLGPMLNRLGAVRACPENAERLLGQEAVVGVFPEGIKGISKLYRERYQLQRFGRGGYVKLALRARAPLVPVAIIGAEEAYPMLARPRFLSKALGMPFLPITPTFPWFGPVGLLPLPSRWQISFGPPIEGLDAYGPEAADDIALVNELNARIRAVVQKLVDDARAERGERVFV